MDPRDLPSVSKRNSSKALDRLGRWWSGLTSDSAFADDVPEATDGSTAAPSRPRLTKSKGVDLRKKSKSVVLSSSAADKFLGTAATASSGQREQLPPFIIHPLASGYRLWWYTTVVVAAITALLEPYVIAFTDPGLYPYSSGTSIMEYICMGLIVSDMAISFNVARYHNGDLVTDRRQLARSYMRLIFWVDLISVIPLDEIALAIAGLNGPKSVANPQLAQYLSLLKLVRMLRMYRLSWFFSYLTVNLAAPLLLVTLFRNVFATFFLANFSACAFYFEARQAGFGPTTWVGANSAWFAGADTAQMYTYSLYWSVITLATVGYGDLRAYNAVEAGLITWWVLFVFFYTAYIIGSITLLVVKGDEKNGEYREQMRALQQYSALNNLPQDLRESMLRHLKLHFYNSQSSDEKVLSAYPSTIRRRVLRQLYLAALRSVYLFAGAKQRFLDALLAGSRVELYLPGVEILAEGDFVNELFIVVAGEVQATSAAGAVGREAIGPGLSEVVLGDGNKSVRGGRTRMLQDGAVFGEIAFFTGTAQMETVTTVSTVRVLAISKAAYEALSQTFRDSARSVLTRLAEEADRAAQFEFGGSGGWAVYQQVLSSDLIRKQSSFVGAGSSAAAAAAAPGDAAWRLPPGAAASLGLSPRQEAAVGCLVRVQGVVSQFVAKHDEDRVMEWLYSASRGDNAKLREMLGHGFDPNSSDYDQRSALMLSAGHGYRDTVALLLEAGADPAQGDAFGGTALWEACKGGHDDCVELLRDAGAKLGKSGVALASLLCSAVFEGDLKLLRRLLRAGADVNAGDYDQRTALHVAAAEGNLAAAELLVDEGGADLAVRDRWGATPADEAKRVGAALVAGFLQQQAQRRA